jgi:hypothetical protein
MAVRIDDKFNLTAGRRSFTLWVCRRLVKVPPSKDDRIGQALPQLQHEKVVLELLTRKFGGFSGSQGPMKAGATRGNGTKETKQDFGPPPV